MCDIKASYQAKASLTWTKRDLDDFNLTESNVLFVSDEANRPIPRALEVFGVLSGLPFSEHAQAQINDLQKELTAFIPHDRYYWVHPENLGIEYLVLKWPDEKWSQSKHEAALRELSALEFSPFDMEFHGFQLNADGCLIVRGYDHSGEFARIRKWLTERLSFVSARQSSWYHIPIGRILKPLGEGNFSALRHCVEATSMEMRFIERIRVIKLIHETRWYMEEHSIVAQKLAS